MTSLDLEATKNHARKLLDSRIESVAQLVVNRKHVDELRAQLADAQREEKKAYVRAVKDGWSEDELKKLGLEAGGAAKRRARRTVSIESTSGPSTLPDTNIAEGSEDRKDGTL